MRPNVAADFEHDLRGGTEAQRARVPAPARTVDVDRDGAAERQEPVAAESLAPDAEKPAERRAALVVDDAARIKRPDMRTTPGRDHPPQVATPTLEPDRRRNDDDPTPGEQFDVNAQPFRERRLTTGKARNRRPRRWMEARARADRRRNHPERQSRSADAKPSRNHRHQAMRAVVCLLVSAVAAGIVTSPALADGDPASDYLIGQNVFLGYDAKIPAPLENKLVAAVASANKREFPVKVALIWSRYDMGSVPELFNKPKTYARFLDAEDSKCWWGGQCGSGRFQTTTRLVVVMPKGLGFAQWQHSPNAGYRTLAGIKVTPTAAGLSRAATTAVVKLAAAAGVRVSTRGHSGTPDGTNGGSSNRIEIIVAVVVALLIGVTARILIRRRAAGSAVD
jgi:hypothetical protein